MSEIAKEHFMLRHKVLLWPLGGTMFGTIVIPVLTLQYPDYFSRNVWLLPVSLVLMLLCWIIPFLFHPRAKAVYQRITSIPRFGRPLFALIVIALTAGLFFGSRKLFKFHRDHIQRMIAQSPPPPPAAPSYPPSQLNDPPTPFELEPEKQNIAFTKEQQEYADTLKREYGKSLVYMESGKVGNQVHNTGFFIDYNGTLIADRNANGEDVTVFVDGLPYKPQKVSPPKKNMSLRISVFRIPHFKGKSKPILIFSEKPHEGQVLAGLSIEAGSDDRESVLGKMKPLTNSDLFVWSSIMKAGANGAPIFNSSGQAIAMLVFQGKGESKCVRFSPDLSRFMVTK